MNRILHIAIVACFFQVCAVKGQSPHGKNLAIDCAKCHSPESWDFNKNFSTFNHDTTAFALTGSHSTVECRSCHTSLEFDKAPTDCISCHTDFHNQTVGNDCARCHNTDSWIVQNLTQMHERTSFPLVGVHASVDCNQCHQAETNVRFNPTGLDCYSCHQSDFTNTKNPNHIKNNFSTDCASCHSITNGFDWNTQIGNHDFFPLTGGHNITDCAACHDVNDFSKVSADCFSCHEKDFNDTKNPNHAAAGFSIDCKSCHSTDPGWSPVTFSQHDGQYFPIYTGKHKGVWKDCNECHLQEGNFASYSCIACHKDPITSNAHATVSGYVYQDNACLACHPTGDASQAFNHDLTSFSLTGVHRTTDCKECHANGYKGTPSQCRDCHITDFNNTKNPNHKSIGLSEDCAGCHTTNIDWMPANFNVHDDYYVLKGMHKTIANDCISCHKGDYNATPNTCAGCHNSDYTSAKNPDHILNNISNDCASCHSENAWSPSTFAHDGFFPIFSGKHNDVWVNCNECHTQNDNFASFDCLNCHKANETNPLHTNVSGYSYENNACFACHPTGDATTAFNHNTTNFPLTGAHNTVNCIECHANGFENTSTACVDCHLQNFNQAANPNHQQLNLSKDCASCHNTAPGWAPASFANHNEIFEIKGQHTAIANDCAACHQGNYNNTPNTCVGCHLSDYNTTLDPNHAVAQFPTDCASCHNENGWLPSNFNHDGQYFPVYSGKHKGEWSQCIDCHNNPNDYGQFTCITCHQNPETNNQHTSVSGYIYQSNACLACHPTGDADIIFNHNATSFALSGVHNNVDCIQCHASGFENTPTSCVGCHLNDFNQSQNPNHVSLNIPQDCASCHSTSSPGWAPASFAIHSQYYAFNGAHSNIANECASCHNSNYNATPNTCNGCHNNEYLATTNPNHTLAQFPVDCASCHNENAWNPANFNHDGQYFPIYSGSHQGQWTQCIDCHSNTSNYSIVVCTTCHQNPETNNDHIAVNGYVYSSPACLACHPTGEANGMSFNHNTTNFPLSGGHLGVDCIQCHANGYQGTTMVCRDCHLNDYNSSLNPNHTALNIPQDCASCHTTNPGWAPASFAIHNSIWPLTGAHSSVNCIDCHIGGNYNNTPTDCNGCHNNSYTTAINPNHVALNLSTHCASCHSTNPGWAPASFTIHNSIWPITGAHTSVNCIDCHIGGNYNNTPTDCNGCHINDYTTATNPNHVALNLSTDCASCHTTNPGWNPATFATHNAIYSLTGSHATVSCNECHIGGNYSNTPNTCNGCHNNAYTTATNPNHLALNFSTDCASCHTTNPGWNPATFATHNSIYPLTGAHASVNCNECHIGGNYSNTPNTCNGCHNSDYTTATNPNHVALNLSTDCASCHTTNPGWAPATFAIHNSIWPLTGAHTTVNCSECHIGGNYNNTPNTCNGCHNSNYTSATNPNHVALNLSIDCASCHTTNPGWAPATFAIHNSIWPLTGTHATTSCVDCHTGGNYNNTPNTCNGCHNSNYTSTTNPNHVALNIPISCEDCHGTGPEWSPATFGIHSQYWPFQGAHIAIQNNCVLCHSNGYTNTPNTCFGCHANEYNSANNPNHLAAGFPTDCTTCHTQSAWTPSNWDHDGMYFPIYSGKHEGVWTNCNECHTTPNNFTIFNCLNCHAAGPTNSEHSGVSGYQYNSNACFQCHPQGED